VAEPFSKHTEAAPADRHGVVWFSSPAQTNAHCFRELKQIPGIFSVLSPETGSYNTISFLCNPCINFHIGLWLWYIFVCDGPKGDPLDMKMKIIAMRLFLP
jgi:hypothetical protein